MSIIQEQIEKLRKKIESYRALQEDLGETAKQKIVELEEELQALIQTEGGAFIAGDVQTGGGAFIGRDQVLATLADRSIIIGGNASGLIVITGDGNQITLSPDQVSPSVILQAYYRALMLECRRLPLGVVDPNFMAPLEQDQVALNDVYTDLHVVSGLRVSEEEKDSHSWGMRLARGDGGERIKLMGAIGESQARLLALVGDPGSGKTTFTNYLTYLLANDYLTQQANELPDSLHGLLPVRLTLRHAARYLPMDGTRGVVGMLWDALQTEIAGRIGAAAAQVVLPYLQAQIAQQGGLFLLDGLDEVPDADRRRKCLLEAVHDLSEHLASKSRILLTARPYAYADPKWRLPKFDLLVLAPFDDQQVERFVERWYRAVRSVMGWDEKTAEQRSERLARGIQQRPYLADLASRPLLLTLMATLDSSWGKLPEDRADLYEESVKLLLSRWQRGREVRNEQGGLDWEPSITRALGVGEELIRSALEKLAYLTHVRQSAEQERDGDSADIPRAEVLQAFCDVLPEDVNAELVLRYLETRSGLLMGRRENVYAFPHRSFQEYLAACHLAAVEQDLSLKLRALVYEDLDWWREVFLLGVGKQRLGGLGGAVGLVSMLLPAEVEYAKDITETDWRVSVLAGQALLEMRLEERSPGQVSFHEIMARAARWLVRIVESGHLTPAQRLEAGDTLASLGDPRFDEKLWSLPVLLRGKPEALLGFVHIPGGAFVMGSADEEKDAYKDERPQHKLNLPDFYMARYPVTNAQYAHFMEAGGYETERYWTPQGWDWRQGRDFDLSLIKDDDLRKNYQDWLSGRPQEKRGQPYWWNHPQWGAPTRPVVGVCWYETLAYCAWLEELLKTFSLERLAQGGLSAQESTFWNELAKGTLRVGLPSEAHWEKAARMSIENRQSKIKNPIYPWGNEISPEHANYDETGLKQTSPMGMFPKGASALGLFDLSGNVWEWTHTRWGLDLYNSTFNYPYLSDEREAEDAPDFRVLRGGSWFNDGRRARCAFRYGLIPDNFDVNLGFRLMVSPGYSAYGS